MSQIPFSAAPSANQLLYQTPKTGHILVVDDIPDNCFLIQTLLQEEGYQIVSINSGVEALEYIQQSPPDLLLLDVMMPEMDGYEVTRRIRQNPSLPFMPILLITAHDQANVARGLDVGADEFIRKPIELDELVARVRSLLRLKHSVDERDRIARQREDFVSRLAHDLRIPLIAADRMLTLFQQGALGELTPAMEEAIATMLCSNQNLLTIVNMLLEVYRYEAGRKTLTFLPIGMTELLQEVVTELQPLATEKGLTLTYEFSMLEGGLGMGNVLGDRLELRRVITNLLDNAIKFTDVGSIQVSLRPGSFKTSIAQNPATPAIVMKVVDTGSGIPAEDLSTLFESFIPGKHRRSGSGLGLHLSSRIVEAHQGKLEVKSKVGKGSVFSVYLPTLGNTDPLYTNPEIKPRSL